MSYLGAFTNQMVAFSSELCESFPEDADLKLALNMVMLMKKANPRKLADLFDRHVSCFRDRITAKDETFFMEETFDDLGNNLGKSEYTGTLVTQLKAHWGDMTDTNKEAIWKYFFVLFKLSDLLKEPTQ